MNFVVICRGDFVFQLRRYSTSKKDEEKVLPKNVLENKYQGAQAQPNGPIVDNKPFKIALKAGSVHHLHL